MVKDDGYRFHHFHWNSTPESLRKHLDFCYPTLNGVDFPVEQFESQRESLVWLKVHSVVNHRATALRVIGLPGWVVGVCIREIRQ